MIGELKNIKYIDIIYVTDIPVVEISDIEKYIELIKIYSPKVIFVKTTNDSNKNRRTRYYDEEDENSYFLFYGGGITFRIRNKNYKNIPDMVEGLSKGFSEGNEYYDAMQRGFVDYKEYSDAISRGYENRDDYLKSEKLGYRGSLEKIKKINYECEHEDYECYEYESKVEEIVYKFKKEYDIYYYGKENGFDSFEELKEALSRLFITSKEYHDAVQKGFSNGAEYNEAKNMGFNDPNEFHEALKLEIKTKKEYDLYLNLLKFKEKFNLNAIEEALLFKILVALKPKKKLSAEKIWQKLESEKSKFEVNEGWYGKVLPEWFDKAFEDKESLKNYLSKSKKINQIGFYDIEGEVFERKTDLQTRKIIVDGSNVAWGNGSKDLGDKPYAKNIRLVVDALREKGYSDVMVIIDASLDYQIEDADILKKLEKEKIINRSPAKRDADEFILKYVKEYNAYVITNDTFKKWRREDEWVEKNIEKYRVSFMIDGDIVKFDEKIENIGG